MLAITITEDKLMLDDGSAEIITRIDSESPSKLRGYEDHLRTSRKINETLPVDDDHPLVKFATEVGVTDAVPKVQEAMEAYRSQARMDAVLLTLMLPNFKRGIVPGQGVVALPKFPVEITEQHWQNDEADADAIMVDAPPSPRRDRNSAVETMITAIYAMLEANPKLQAALLDKIMHYNIGGSVANDKDAGFPDKRGLEGNLAGTSQPDSGSGEGNLHESDSPIHEGAEAG